MMAHSKKGGDDMEKLTIGIDIGGTNFRIGAVTPGGQVLYFEKMSSRIFDRGDVVQTLCGQINAYTERYGIRERVAAAAVGIPSIVSKDKRTILSAPNLKGFDNLPFSDRLGALLGMPVFLDRDVNFLLMNDIDKLGLDRDSTVLGFYVGTGFGNALYLNGSLYAGKNGAAGELGHIPLYGVEDVCTCGNVGCSETRCSGKYLEQLTARHFPDTEIRDVFKYHADDPIIVKFVEDLALVIATEINILDPDYSVIAGGVVFMDHFPKDVLLRAIHRMARKPYPEENLELLFAEHTQQSGIYGSGMYAHAQLK